MSNESRYELKRKKKKRRLLSSKKKTSSGEFKRKSLSASFLVVLRRITWCIYKEYVESLDTALG